MTTVSTGRLDSVPPDPTPAGGAEAPLSVLLRAATRTAHERAEGMPFVADLMHGRLEAAAYVDLLAQHHVIYGALEAAEPFVRQDEAGRTVLFDGLARLPSIEADLVALAGPAWRARIRVHPATLRYADRLRQVAGTWVGGYVAHAYTRYLGDLSGGQAIKAVLGRTYGLGAEGLNFYTFPAIAKPKVFKDSYRSRLDALPFDGGERARIADEACVAFDLNAAVLAELGAAHRS